MGTFLATLRTPVNLFKGKIYEISGSQHTQKLNNRKEMRVKKKWIPKAKGMGIGGKETSQRFPLVAAKRKHNT